MQTSKIVAFLVALIVIWAGLTGLINFYWPEQTLRAGVLGDSFGAVNALFSGLALGGVVFAILLQRTELSLQRKELRLQRQEMELNRTELEGQKEQLQLQAKQMHLDAFDTQFFQLLKEYKEIINRLDIIGNGNGWTGTRALSEAAERESSTNGTGLAPLYTNAAFGDDIWRVCKTLRCLVRIVSNPVGSDFHGSVLDAVVGVDERTLLLLHLNRMRLEESDRSAAEWLSKNKFFKDCKEPREIRNDAIFRFGFPFEFRQ
jgi:hypothetical protein